MPYRPKVPCKQTGCAALVEPGKQYCEKHLPLHPEVTRSAGKRGYGSRWQRESKQFLQSHPLCAECMKQGRYTTQMVQDLEGMGFTVVPFGQGFKNMSPPTKEFYKLLMEGKIIHGGNPVLRWMSGNVVVDRDPAENIKPTKAKSPEKIDGIVAAIMALDRCIRNQGQQGSVYDERPLIVF